MQIRDGKGRGNLAEVTKDQQLVTLSTMRTQEHAVALEGDSYFTNISATAPSLTTTVTGGYMLLLKHTSESVKRIIQLIIASTSVDGGVMQFIRNPTLGTLGNNVAATTVNTNMASGREAVIEANSWDEVGDGITGVSEGEIINTFVLPKGVHFFPILGAFVMGNNNILGVRYSGVIAEFALGIRHYSHS